MTNLGSNIIDIIILTLLNYRYKSFCIDVWKLVWLRLASLRFFLFLFTRLFCIFINAFPTLMNKAVSIFKSVKIWYCALSLGWLLFFNFLFRQECQTYNPKISLFFQFSHYFKLPLIIIKSKTKRFSKKSYYFACLILMLFIFKISKTPCGLISLFLELFYKNIVKY